MIVHFKESSSQLNVRTTQSTEEGRLQLGSQLRLTQGIIPRQSEYICRFTACTVHVHSEVKVKLYNPVLYIKGKIAEKDVEELGDNNMDPLELKLRETARNHALRTKIRSKSKGITK